MLKGHNQNVFDLKFNSLFLIRFPFLFANIRIFISLVLLRIFLSSFSLCTVYQFSLKRLCVDFVVAWNHSTLHSLSHSPFNLIFSLISPSHSCLIPSVYLFLSLALRSRFWWTPHMQNTMAYIHKHTRTHVHIQTCEFVIIIIKGSAILVRVLCQSR